MHCGIRGASKEYADVQQGLLPILTKFVPGTFRNTIERNAALIIRQKVSKPLEICSGAI